MTSDRNYATKAVVQIEKHTFEVVDRFTYLGAIVQMDNDTTHEIKHQINMANKCYFGLLRTMKRRVLSRSVKVCLYKTLIRPVLTYACETWTISKNNEYALQYFERKILRRVYGPICENGVWRKRYNQELYDLFKDVDISKFIKLTRLRWAGHVRRKEDSEICKMIWSAQPEGSRKRGRPRLRWKDEVDGDARDLGLRNWWREALDRANWRKILEEAKTQK